LADKVASRLQVNVNFCRQHAAEAGRQEGRIAHVFICSIYFVVYLLQILHRVAVK
jgi:hypothetical protein